MLILLLQIGLVAFAWMRGWRQWALLPPGVAFVLGVLLSGVVATIGGDPGSVSWLSFLFDMGSLVVLTGMIRRPLKQTQLTAQTPVTPIAAASTVEAAEQVTIH